MIQFILNHQIIKTSAHSGITLLDFIREHRQLKGTKIGCREGDCGACTVLVGTPYGDQVDYKSITSCISPLGNAHGKHIVTIEGINLPSELNAVQNAMADNYATQCGFCTPGFVVSMTGYALKSKAQNTKESPSCNDAISGNICRCTGYKSIEKAGYSIEQKLSKKNKNLTLSWLVKEGFIPEYFEDIPDKLRALQDAIKETEPDDHTFESSKKITKVANGTDLYVRHADRLAVENIELLVDHPKLKGISIASGICTIGANTTVTEIAENEVLNTFFPKLKGFIKLISSEQIRNMGTLGGNFVNASPIGDMSIFFLALNSTLTISKDDGSERQIPFQSFHKEYKSYDLEENEVLKSISFRTPTENEFFNFEKVSKRTHLDIASVNSAATISILEGKINQAHIAVGGVSAIPKYLTDTNQYLVGKALTFETVHKAIEVMQSEISPISDVRGASDYKRLLARQLFLCHFVECFPHQLDLEKLISI